MTLTPSLLQWEERSVGYRSAKLPRVGARESGDLLGMVTRPSTMGGMPDGWMKV